MHCTTVGSIGVTASCKKNIVGNGETEYCGLGKHILLLLFTFGIWQSIRIYRTTKYTNIKSEEYRNPTTKLLLCMFVPFYMIFRIYKTAQRIDRMSAAKGIACDSATVCPVPAIFVPIVPPILMQDKLNTVVKAKPVQPIENRPTAPSAEEIEKYKELLDRRHHGGRI